MTKTFENAEQARDCLYELERQLNRLPYNGDLYKLYYNLKPFINKMSQLEVYIRRAGKRSRYHTEYVKLSKELSQAMGYLDNMLLIARLVA